MSLLDRVLAAPTVGCALPHLGFVRYRQAHAGAGAIPLVLLHGIGSGSGSWIELLDNDQLGHVLAWDAPGYADSTPLTAPEPKAADYGRILWAWLDQLKVESVHLVGHSLGCIMAAAAAGLRPDRVKALTLLAPAQGYGSASLAVQQQKRDERLQAMASLGLQKMAQQRALRLLSPSANTQQLALAIDMMSRLNEGGYTQATSMLSHADIRMDLDSFRHSSHSPIAVACGDQDIITPPEGCRKLAELVAAPYVELLGAGHLCALEAPMPIADLLIQTQKAIHG